MCPPTTDESLFSEPPIPFEDFPMSKMDLTLLPPPLYDFVVGVADSLQVPIELPFINSVGVMSAAIQGKAQIVIREGYVEPLNIYAITALPSGERKSPTVLLCKQPLHEWEDEDLSEVLANRQEIESKRKSLEKVIECRRAKLASIKSKDLVCQEIQAILQLEKELPNIPEKPRIFIDDATPEAVAAVLAKQGERIAIIEAEGGILDLLAGRYAKGMPNIDLFLKAWSGEPVVVDRQKNGCTHLRSPSITMILSPQPSVIRKLAKTAEFRSRGLLARFLYLLPKSRVGSRIMRTNPVPKGIIDSYHAVIRTALEIRCSGHRNGRCIPHSIDLSPETKALYFDFAEEVERKMKKGGELESMTDWGSKLPGNIVRLSGLFHFFASTSPLTEPISENIMRAALALADPFIEHAKCAFSLMAASEAEIAAGKILTWINEFCSDTRHSFTGRECLRALRGTLPSMEKINSGLTFLMERNYITKKIEHNSKKKGPKSHVYRIHPSLLRKNSKS